MLYGNKTKRSDMRDDMDDLESLDERVREMEMERTARDTEMEMSMGGTEAMVPEEEELPNAFDDLDDMMG